jgi:hypothetical protein
MIARLLSDAKEATNRDRALTVILSLLTLGMAIGQKDFAKLGIPVGSVWIYPLDVGLGICLCLVFPAVIDLVRRPYGRPLWQILVLIYVGLGAIYCVEALAPYRIIAVKDYAFVYYALFSIVLFVWVDKKERYELLGLLLIIGVSLATGRNYFDAAQGVESSYYRRPDFSDVTSYGGPILSLYSGLVFLIAFAMLVKNQASFKPAWAALLVFHWGNLILGETRSAYLGIGFGIIVVIGLAKERTQAVRNGALIMVALVASTICVLVAFPQSKLASHIRGSYNSMVSVIPKVQTGAATKSNLSPTTLSVPTAQPTLIGTAAVSKAKPNLDRAGDVPSGTSDSIRTPSIGSLTSPKESPTPSPTNTVALDLNDHSGRWRLARWQEGLTLFQKSPIFGQGFGRPIVTYTTHKEPREDEFNFGLPHNTYLVSLIRQGVLGTALLLATLVAAAWGALRVLGKLTVDHRADLSIALALATAGLVYGFFSLFFESPHTAAPFWMIVGIGSAIATWVQREGSEPVT